MQGLLLARGPGIMKGYFNDEAATAKAFSAGNGWFDTGDLGWRAPSEHLTLSSVSYCLQGGEQKLPLSLMSDPVNVSARHTCTSLFLL